MDLRLNEDQSMMKKVAADFVKSEAPSYVITDWFQKKIAFIPELYQKTAEVGWLGMMLPEEYGGGGASCTDCAAVFEELGRGPLPGPIFPREYWQPRLFWQAVRRCRRKLCCRKSVTAGPL